MSLSAAEQYLLEMVNRARLDPAAEAARYGISLNAGLASGTISTAAKGVLAHNTNLEIAALAHSNWMIANDIFSHTGSGGSQPQDRAVSAGYTSYSSIGENVAWSGTTGSTSVALEIAKLHEGLFKSAGHRENMLFGTFREVGVGAVDGTFTQSGNDYDAAMLTTLFGAKGSAVFLTGVTYTDGDDNDFYTMGEGLSAVTFTAQGKTATTATAGGYNLSLTTDSTQDVSGKVGAKSFTVQLDMGSGNAKLDIVDSATFFTSVDITLKTGIHKARLLGVADLDATGNSSANTLYGNKGANKIVANGGNDTSYGGAGKDSIYGGDNNDLLYGGDQNDVIYGGAQDDFVYGGGSVDKIYGGSDQDYLYGGSSGDYLYAGSGNDTISGGTGADKHYFYNNFGTDRITDFSVSGGDVLKFDDAIWGGAAKTEAQLVAQYASIAGGVVVLNFGAGEVLTLSGVTTTAGLAAQIDIF